MSSHRQLRVRELLKRELSEILRRELPIREAGLITVNEVAMSSDLKSALVYVGVLGNADQQKRALELLKRERARLQGLVAHSVVLKYTPHLNFLLDDSIERGNRVLAILDDLERSQPES